MDAGVYVYDHLYLNCCPEGGTVDLQVFSCLSDFDRQQNKLRHKTLPLYNSIRFAVYLLRGHRSRPHSLAQFTLSKPIPHNDSYAAFYLDAFVVILPFICES